MKFSANHEIIGGYTQESEFDTSSNDFNCDIGRFCANTGNAAKDYSAFEMVEKAEKTGEKYNNIAVSVAIVLKVYFGDIYDKGSFTESCSVEVIYTLEPAEPGLYRLNFSEAGREIANLVLAKYQHLFKI